MAINFETAQSLGKMIRLLASDNDGDVIATARAIKRTLESAGNDFHDLAAIIAGDEKAPARVIFRDAPLREDPRPTPKQQSGGRPVRPINSGDYRYVIGIVPFLLDGDLSVTEKGIRQRHAARRQKPERKFQNE